MNKILILVQFENFATHFVQFSQNQMEHVLYITSQKVIVDITQSLVFVIHPHFALLGFLYSL